MCETSNVIYETSLYFSGFMNTLKDVLLDLQLKDQSPSDAWC